MAFAGFVKGLDDAEPREARFLPDRIEVTTTTRVDNDPRCCPTAMTRRSVDRATLRAARLP